ncbi:hypothetical protein HPB50_015183 [Hyalomma asiaticum]|uniref:Uncharacterized protein n=1 Tax=Hyalomma asiaticum TaxID=266040 RepID=A0ACB7SN12_HYAAI|nr:hypothetical protein HPB50_015183 [Hyalomma asiaticum]
MSFGDQDYSSRGEIAIARLSDRGFGWEGAEERGEHIVHCLQRPAVWARAEASWAVRWSRRVPAALLALHALASSGGGDRNLLRPPKLLARRTIGLTLPACLATPLYYPQCEVLGDRCARL